MVILWHQTFFLEAWAIHVLLPVGYYPKKISFKFYLLQAHLSFIVGSSRLGTLPT